MAAADMYEEEEEMLEGVELLEQLLRLLSINSGCRRRGRQGQDVVAVAAVVDVDGGYPG